MLKRGDRMDEAIIAYILHEALMVRWASEWMCLCVGGGGKSYRAELNKLLVNGFSVIKSIYK